MEIVIFLVKNDKNRLVFNNKNVKMINIYNIVDVDNNTIYIMDIYLDFGFKIIFKSISFERIEELESIIKQLNFRTEVFKYTKFEISKEFSEEYLIEEYIK